MPPPLPPHFFQPLTRPRTKEELALLGLEDYKPNSGSPDSNRSDSSSKYDDKYSIAQSRPSDQPITPPKEFVPLPLANMSLPHFPHSAFIHPTPYNPFVHNPPIIFPPTFHPLYSRHLNAIFGQVENNNNLRVNDHNTESSKIFFNDILKQQGSVSTMQEDISDAEFVITPPAERRTSASPLADTLQENPMDLSVKSDGRSSSARRRSDESELIVPDQDDPESASDRASASEEEELSYSQIKRIKLHPLDLTTKV